MIDYTDLNRKVRRVVELCTDMAPGTVRPAEQAAGATGDQFATVLLMPYAGSGIAAKSYENIPDDAQERVTETQDAHVRVTASIQFFRGSAKTLANKLRDRITLTSALQLMRSQGIGYISGSNVRSNSMVVNNSWEERAVVDIDFYVVSTETDVVTTFGQFPITVSDGNSST